MKDETFVDTSGFYALLAKNDSMHQKARRILRRGAQNRAAFATTDYVLDETATLLKSRGQGRLLAAFFDSIFGSDACDLVWMTPERFEKVRIFCIKHADKSWSFTDCFSFCVMQERQMSRALTKDFHFRQAGFTPLLAEKSR